MSKQASTAAIGAFVVGAIALAFAAIAVLGSGKFFRDSVTYVAVFDTSVKGLNVGAPVQFRGVPLGSVARIEIDRVQTNGGTEKILIPVFLNISPDYADIKNQGKLSRKEMRQAMDELIRGGLRARLTMQSFVTGLLEIELVIDPDEPPIMTGIVKGVPEIPVVPTSLEQVKLDILQFFDELKKVPLQKIVKDLHESIAAVRSLADSPDLKGAIASLDKLLSDPALQESAKNLDELLINSNELVKTLHQDSGPVLEDFGQAARALGKAASSAEDTLTRIADNVDHDSAMYYEINNTLEQVGAAARSLTTLANYLNQHPEALLKGKQADKKEN